MRNSYTVLVRKHEGRRTVWRFKRRWEDNIKMDLKYIYDVRICNGFLWLRIESVAASCSHGGKFVD
jgi:hypothetical protein